MVQRVAVVTGASSGIGKETAKALAADGWRVIALGRDPARSAAAVAELAAIGDITMIVADLAVLADADRAAREIADHVDRIDVLVNNAGGVTAVRQVTVDGNEAAFAGNHLGPFLLTDRLLPLLRQTAATAPAGGVRIVVTSSLAHESAPGFDWDDPQSLETFVSVSAYSNAKLANLLFTRALARRLADDGITVNAMHPGIVDTNFASHGTESMQAYFQAKAGQLTSAADAADTLIWLATDPAVAAATGGYYEKRQPIPGSEMSRDPALADRLWDVSAALVAEAGFPVG